MASLGHPCKFQQLSRLGSVTPRHSSSGRQPNFAALNRGRHLYLTGRPSRSALAHILVFYLSFFPRLISAVADSMSAILTWCGLSANLGCRSETCWTWSLKIQDAKNRQKIRHLRTIAQLCWTISSELGISTIGKKTRTAPDGF